MVETTVVVRGSRKKTNTQSSSDALFNASKTHHLPQQQATLHTKWHEFAQEDRASSVSRDASISPNRERDQGPFTLTLRIGRQRLCEGRTGRAIIVMTIASEQRKTRPGKSSVTQRLGALKEDEALKLRGLQVPMQSSSMSGKEPGKQGEGDQGDHQTNDAVGGRTAPWQPAHHPKGWEVTACSPMCKQWADNWSAATQ